MTATTTHTTTWTLSGVGYEYCNCNPGCSCNFGGFPSSRDGSCRALAAYVFREGRCGDVDLSGLTAAAVFDWPRAIHDGGGRAAFVVPPEATDEQADALGQIYTGSLGGMPWEILGTTFDVVAMTKAPITFSGSGLDLGVHVEGVGSARGGPLRNPVTGDPHEAHITLPDGFIWTDGNCGVGSFNAFIGGIELDAADTSCIHFDFDWSNAG